MTSKVLLVALFPLTIAGCGTPAPTTTQPDANTMAGMTIPSEGKSGHGAGVIKALDRTAGKVTLAHGPVAELRWPAMTMGFSAPVAMLDGLAVGDRVAFAFNWDGKAGKLTSIAKR
ncbi:MAG: copper-binding protein [Pseudomonadota bacterium]